MDSTRKSPRNLTLVVHIDEKTYSPWVSRSKMHFFMLGIIIVL